LKASQLKMTDCCLFVCWRPHTYQRLVTDVYNASLKDKNSEEVIPNAGKIKKLTDYAALYPAKLRLIANKLNKAFNRGLRKDTCGFVLITIEIYKSLVEKFHSIQLSYMLEVHLDFILSELVASRNIVYLKAAVILLKSCVVNNVFSSKCTFVNSILQLCSLYYIQANNTYSGNNEADEEAKEQQLQHCSSLSFIGFTIMYTVIKLFHNNTHWLQIYLHPILTILTNTFTMIIPSTDQVSRLNQQLFEQENIASQNQILITRITTMPPRSLLDIIWKAFYDLCSTDSINLLRKISHQLFFNFEMKNISLSSHFSYQIITIIMTAYQRKTQIQNIPLEFTEINRNINTRKSEFSIETVIYDYLSYRLLRSALIYSSNEYNSSSSSSSSFNEFEVIDIDQYHGNNFHHFRIIEGSESIISHLEPHLLVIKQLLSTLVLWNLYYQTSSVNENEEVETHQIHDLQMFHSIIKSNFFLLSFLIKYFPFLRKTLYLPNIESSEIAESEKLNPMTTLLLEIRQLSTNQEEDGYESIDITENLQEQQLRQEVNDVLNLLYRSMKMISFQLIALGSNFTICFQDIFQTMQQMEQQQFLGNYQTNISISTYRIYSLYMIQCILEYLPISYITFELTFSQNISQLISSSSSNNSNNNHNNNHHHNNNAIITSNIFIMIEDILFVAKSFSEIQQGFLCIMKIMEKFQPLITQFHQSSTNRTLLNKIEELPHDENLEWILESIVLGSYYPWSFNQIYRLYGLLHRFIDNHQSASLQLIEQQQQQQQQGILRTTICCLFQTFLFLVYDEQMIISSLPGLHTLLEDHKFILLQHTTPDNHEINSHHALESHDQQEAHATFFLLASLLSLSYIHQLEALNRFLIQWYQCLLSYQQEMIQLAETNNTIIRWILPISLLLNIKDFTVNTNSMNTNTNAPTHLQMDSLILIMNIQKKKQYQRKIDELLAVGNYRPLSISALLPLLDVPNLLKLFLDHHSFHSMTRVLSNAFAIKSDGDNIMKYYQLLLSIVSNGFIVSPKLTLMQTTIDPSIISSPSRISRQQQEEEEEEKEEEEEEEEEIKVNDPDLHTTSTSLSLEIEHKSSEIHEEKVEEEKQHDISDADEKQSDGGESIVSGASSSIASNIIIRDGRKKGQQQSRRLFTYINPLTTKTNQQIENRNSNISQQHNNNNNQSSPKSLNQQSTFTPLKGRGQLQQRQQQFSSLKRGGKDGFDETRTIGTAPSEYTKASRKTVVSQVSSNYHQHRKRASQFLKLQQSQSQSQQIHHTPVFQGIIMNDPHHPYHLAMNEEYLIEDHMYPPISLPYRTKVWRDVFTMSFEELQVYDHVSYICFHFLYFSI
jgi:hypothetical protein